MKLENLAQPIDVAAFLQRADIPPDAKARVRQAGVCTEDSDAARAHAHRLMQARILIEVEKLKQIVEFHVTLGRVTTQREYAHFRILAKDKASATSKIEALLSGQPQWLDIDPHDDEPDMLFRTAEYYRELGLDHEAIDFRPHEDGPAVEYGYNIVGPFGESEAEAIARREEEREAEARADARAADAEDEDESRGAAG